MSDIDVEVVENGRATDSGAYGEAGRVSCVCCASDHEHEHEDEGEAFFTPLNIVGIALFVIGFAAEHFIDTVWWVSLALLLAAYLIIGREVFVMAGRNIKRGQVFDENFLMCVASIGAFVIGEYPEAVAVMLFYMIGEYFQDKAVGRSRRSIRALMDIRPDTAWVLEEQTGSRQRFGVATEMRAEDVGVGQIIEIKPGGRVPLDALVIDGAGDIDMMALTGETMPVDVTPGDHILAGAVNGGSLLRAKVEKSFSESTASKIIELAQNASGRKAPAENFITKFARVYTPIVVCFAAGLAVLPPLLGAGPWVDWIMRGLVFLVVSCPCALVISIPVSYFGGIGGASSRGILVKGGNYLDALGRVGTIVFDKTGTLTKGRFRVADIHAAEGFSEDDVLLYAAAAESASTHPIAISIEDRYAEASAPLPDTENIMEKAGYGVAATVGGKVVICGSAKYMEAEGVAYDEADIPGTVVHVAVDGSYAGHIFVVDEIKPDSARAVSELKARGIARTVMLTGDSPRVADAVGASLGIDEVHAGLLPQDKVEILERVMADGASGSVAVVGDGINDAPMLARADVGIAMGGLGSDAAVEAADVVIMNDAPSRIAAAVDVARRTRRIVVQNIALALGVKGAVMLLAVIGIANMWEAVFADVGVALLAVLNAVRAGR
ncbi:MAG: cadmium-translocating P-type ATPase [Clostridiales Family XIII bacterium]|jgi:Cd2+/Zn2+-exporting ATPase|nr:cadmium-translocating P-type ATPase [Clostridiales Family XIII bacterium]